MSFLQPLATKAKAWTRDYGVVAKNLAKISLKTLVPGAGEILAEGIDCIFEIVEHQDDLKWKDRIDQHLKLIQADQQQYLSLLETIEKSIGHLLTDISKEFNQSLNNQSLNNQSLNNQSLNNQSLKSLFDRSFSQNETQYIQLQQQLSNHSKSFQIVEQKLDELYKKQLEVAIELKEGNQSFKDGLEALKQLYQQLSLQIQDKQQEHTKNQVFRDFLVEIEHELIHHNLNRARVILENAFIQKTIDLQFKQLYECKINALQGHLTQIEDLLEKSRELANLKGLANLKQQVKHASRWITHQVEYRTFLHQSGKTIGDKGWQLDIPIGIGGMGEVWKAHNLKGEIGAIKFVHEELLTDTFAKKKFFDEIDSLSKLRHQNIVTLKDWGIENGTHQLYLVMAYIEGETLRQIINRKAYFTWTEAQVIFRDLVEALYICHQSNVIHKDIKPDNIILRGNPKNQPILIDFGISTIQKNTSFTHKTTKHILGTDLYMSPEQKSNGDLDGKSDIYSLGVTLLESLTGKHAIDRTIINLQDDVIDLIEDCLNTWRRRCDAVQLFEKLGGNLQKLRKGDNWSDDIQREIDQLKKEVQQAQNQVMQSDMNYRSLMNEKQALMNEKQVLVNEKQALVNEKQALVNEKQVLANEKQALVKGFEKSIQEKEKLIQRLESEKKQIQDELNRMKVQSAVKLQTPIQSGGSGDPKVGHVSQRSQNQVMSSAVGQLQNVNVNGVSFNMVYCPAGEFWMGSKAEDAKYTYEKPRHKVRMNKGFWMGETQVTQDLWQKVMGWNPSGFKGSTKLPVENVTWYDCLVFCNKLSELEKFTPCFKLTNLETDGDSIKKANIEWLRNANGYRLPTEAEWEYSAKAGTELIYSGSNRVYDVAWYRDNSGDKTHEVKGKKANVWGLYDMSGNVWEWCMDKWDSNEYQSRNNGIENPILWDNSHCGRVVRGGSYGFDADYCRVASRYRDDADRRYDRWGFRLLRCEP